MAKSIALICAAGIGSRMQAQIPKQYLSLEYQGQEQTILGITLQKFLNHPEIDKVIVALNLNDSFFSQLGYGVSESLFHEQKYIYPTNNPKLFYCQGFGERRHSVYSMLSAAIELGMQENWSLDSEPIHVLIHDAVRVGIRNEDITKGIREALEHLTPIAVVLDQVNQAVNHQTATSLSLNNENFKDNVIDSVIDKLQENYRFELESWCTKESNKFVTQHSIHCTSESYADCVQNSFTLNSPTGVILRYQPVIDTLKYRKVQDKTTFNQRCIDRSSIVQAQTPQIVDLVYYYYLLTNLLVAAQDKEFIKYLEQPSLRCFRHPIEIFARVNSLQQLDSRRLAQAMMFKRMPAEQALTYLTDDSSLFDFFEHRIIFVEAGQHNLKITVPQDLALASFYLAQEK